MSVFGETKTCCTSKVCQVPETDARDENGRCENLAETVFPKAKNGSFTLPETNIAPENRPLGKEIPIGNHHLQGLC